MYSMFDLLFDTPAYIPVYGNFDSERRELQRKQNQDEPEEIHHQKKILEEVYKAQVKNLDEREKALKTGLKAIGPAKKSLDFDFLSERGFIILSFHYDQTSSVLLQPCEISFSHISLASSNLNSSLL